jgi:uncharacterized protein
MVFLQAAVSESGPSYACLRLAETGAVRLLLSPRILAEAADVLSRPMVRRKFKTLTEERVQRYLSKVESFSEILPDPPQAFALPRDPKDEIYTNLAIAGGAEYLISWNERHLNYLMEGDTPEGKDFRTRNPDLKILTPQGFLEEIRRRAAGS